VPALIQRLGRLNRRAEDGDPTCPFIIADTLGADGKFSPLPYGADDLETARKWLDECLGEKLFLVKLDLDGGSAWEPWRTTLGDEVLLRVHREFAQVDDMQPKVLKDLLTKRWLSNLSDEEKKEKEKWLDGLEDCELRELGERLVQVDRNLSQAVLAAAWEKLQETDADVPRYLSAWLDFGPATPVLELREGSPNVTVVLEQDWAALKAGEKTLAEVALPMSVPPVKRDKRPFDWNIGQHNGVPVAHKEAITYDPERGATWAK